MTDCQQLITDEKTCKHNLEGDYQFDHNYEFPKKDVLNLSVTDPNGESIKLMTYYMPVPQGVQHKATIFYVHGYGAYAGEFAFYLREFANQGYQVFGMDQRGFGHSEGERGLFESDDQIIHDYQLFIFEAIKQFKLNSQEQPFFLLGRSWGGLLTTHIAQAFPNMFKGMALITPLYNFYDKSIYSMRYFFTAMNIIWPKMTFQREFAYPEEYYKKWQFYIEEPYNVNFYRAQNCPIMIKKIEAVPQIMLENQVPFIVIEGGKDDSVCGEAIRNAYHNSPLKMKKYVLLKEGDHCTAAYDYPIAIKGIEKTLKFYENILEQLQ